MQRREVSGNKIDNQHCELTSSFVVLLIMVLGMVFSTLTASLFKGHMPEPRKLFTRVDTLTVSIQASLNTTANSYLVIKSPLFS